MIHIPASEYRSRLANLQSQVQASGLDLFLVSGFDSIYFLTGAGFEALERPFFLLVPPHGAPVLLVPKLDHQHMKRAHNVPEENLRTYWDSCDERSWPQRLRTEIGGAHEIGVEPALRQEIAQELTDCHLRVLPLVGQLRLSKSNYEIAMIRRAAQYADLGVRRLLAASYYGSTVAEGFAETRTVNARIIREVRDWDPLMSKVVMATWAAPGSAVPHSVPGLMDRLQQGPHVALVLTRVNGYCAESERTYFTAPPSAECRKMFLAMVEARRIAFSMIRHGLPCHDLDAKVNEFLRREGFASEDQRLHRTGHGIGLETHERPWVAEGSGDRITENMVISIEPGIYIEGVGGVRHSDTVLVTRDGHEVLTNAPAELETLVIRRPRLAARIRGFVMRKALGSVSKR